MQPDLDLILTAAERTRLTRENLRDLRDVLPPVMARELCAGQEISLQRLTCPDGARRRLLVIHSDPQGNGNRAVFQYNPDCPNNGCKKGTWQPGTRIMMFDVEDAWRGVYRRPGCAPKPKGLKLKPEARMAKPGYTFEFIY